MLNYEEELKKFQPSLEVEDIEEAVYREDLPQPAGYGAEINISCVSMCRRQ